jgi:hypothetical protein
LRAKVEERARKRGVTLDPEVFAPRAAPRPRPLAWLRGLVHPAQ